jgi:hypothetical protein
MICSFMAIVSIEEYRKMLNDNVSTDEQIMRRVEYIESLCRNIIRQELQKHADARGVKKDPPES